MVLRDLACNRARGSRELPVERRCQEAGSGHSGLGERTDFVSAGRLVVLEPQSWLGVFLSILQPLSPDIAAFVVAALAFGLGGVVVLVRRYRFWSADVGWRKGLQLWGFMLITFLAMSLGTAGLNYMFAPQGSFEWVNTPVFSWWFPLALLASIFLDIGGVTEETGWRGFALPLLQARMTPLAATLIVGLIWGVGTSQRGPTSFWAPTVCGAARCSSRSSSCGSRSSP